MSGWSTFILVDRNPVLCGGKFKTGNTNLKIGVGVGVGVGVGAGVGVWTGVVDTGFGLVCSGSLV